MKTRIGDISIQIRGVSYKPSDISDENDPQSIAILRANNISNHGEIETSDLVWITQNRVKPEQILRTGDILLCASSGSKGLVGKAAQVTGDYGMSFGAFCKVIRPMIANKKYLGFYFQSPQYRHLISEASAGININNIRAEDLDGLVIEIPSESEQDERCSVLDKVEKAILLRRQQIQKLNDLVKSQFIEMFGDPERNEKGWNIVPLSQIAEYFNGLTYRPEDRDDKGTIVLRSSNIQQGELDFSDIVRVQCRVKEKLYVKSGDILMCSRNGSANLVGKVAQIPQLSEPMTFGAFMMIIRSQVPEYLTTYFRLNAFRNQIKTGATTTINQITTAMLNKVRLPLPPRTITDKFARFVEQTDKSKFRIKQSLEKLEILYKALLQKYFG